MDKLEFLNSYSLSNNTVEIIEDIFLIEQASIPDFWKKTFTSLDTTTKKNRIIKEWSKYVNTELSNTIMYLKEYLIDVDLIKTDKEYSILYTLLSYQTNKEVFYEGKNPLSTQLLMDDSLKIDWKKIDSSITEFYSNIHNGFFVYTSKSMGLDSTENIESMSEYEWYYEDDLAIDIAHLYNFFSNGFGEYIALDVNKRITDGAYLWSTKNLPKGNLNFWDVIDEWIIIGLDF